LSEPFDAHKLMEQAPKVAAFQDDKVLYVTLRKLAPRKLQTGEVPTYGLSQYNGPRAVVSLAHMKNPTENVKQVARHALQELGHTWGLHHCLDPRCAMYPHWTPSYVTGDATFCVFCRETSEQKIRLAKS
jgi:predicted Zn-dependent protease